MILGHLIRSRRANEVTFRNRFTSRREVDRFNPVNSTFSRNDSSGVCVLHVWAAKVRCLHCTAFIRQTQNRNRIL